MFSRIKKVRRNLSAWLLKRLNKKDVRPTREWGRRYKNQAEACRADAKALKEGGEGGQVEAKVFLDASTSHDAGAEELKESATKKFHFYKGVARFIGGKKKE